MVSMTRNLYLPNRHNTGKLSNNRNDSQFPWAGFEEGSEGAKRIFVLLVRSFAGPKALTPFTPRAAVSR